jgi:SAM-dependent methyltransferase
MVKVADKWAAGSAYEDFMGKWSRELAPKFVDWLQVPADSHWLDVGCGTGALTDAICRLANPASVVGCDPARPFIEYARAHQSSRRASFVICGTGSLPSGSGGFGSVTSCLALNFFPEPAGSMVEMRKRTANGGTVSSCVWDYLGRMEFLRIFWDTALRVDPKAAELDEGERFPICRADALVGLFRGSGLRSVSCDPIEISTDFASFDEYWKSFQGGSGPAPSYVASLEEEHRAALAQELEEALPGNSDGSISLVARAWAVRGTVG